VDLGLAGKVAIVAASSKGLGKACALALAREGARVTVCVRTEADLAATAAEIDAATGARVLAVPADLGTAAGIEHVVGAISYITGEVYQIDGGAVASNV
jgi:3-oxoacyl-[acyl-carrier protein] reductase